ncbi:hypothetical protein GCM10028812_24140 [Ancylobacter sonchi]|uniref:phage major capsid protein n=1 Tax=Ancylobacter sonchi TaxID=1937790 RepID=UPI001FEC9DC2|nr:Mu-like prophage major head subunit gpT family protein [Ancylobacter sonchi]
MDNRANSGGEFRAASYDAGSNTIEVVFATEAPVARVLPDGTPYWEILSCQQGHVDLARLNAGASLLDNHDMFGGVDAVIGSVVPGSARLEGRKGVARILLSSAPGDADRVQKIRDGIIRGVSVGYGKTEFQMDASGADGWPVRRFTRWEPWEISVVTVPADPGAHVRSLNGEAIEVRVLREAGERRAEFVENALLHRIDPANPLTDGGREYRGMSLVSIARDFLQANGADTRGKSPHEIAGLATQRGYNGTTDFPTILSNVVNRTLRRAYEAAPATWRPLVNIVSAPDFRELARVAVSDAPPLDRIGEHGEYERARLNDGAAERYRVASYGKIVAISRQAIVNDDLNAFGRLGQMFAQQAAQLESDLIWAQILGNPAMADGHALFSGAHANLAPGANLDELALKVLHARIRKQTAPAGQPLNLRPKYLIVPAELQTRAEQLLKTDFRPATAADALPASLRQLEIIAEPRLDLGISNPAVGAPIAGNAGQFFMAAAPGAIDTVEVAYLLGERRVQLETRVGFSIDGIEFRARLDVGAKAIDHRGLAKNPGE